MKAYLTPEQRKANRRASYKKWRDKTGYEWRKRNPKKAKANRIKNYALKRDEKLSKKKEWNKANPDKLKDYQDNWREKNPEYMHNYYVEHKADYDASRERLMADPMKRKQALETANKLRNYKRKTDIQYRVRESLRCHIKVAVRRFRKGEAAKHDRAENLLGCDLPFFMDYIAAKFQEGMSWKNYGKYTWHLDHIRAVATFNLLNESEMRSCFHYTNYQPLWAIDNMRKGTKVLIFPTANKQETSAVTVASQDAVSAE